MSNAIDPIEEFRQLAESLGLSAADLTEITENLSRHASVPTVADFAPDVIASCNEKSLSTFNSHFRRLVTELGDLRLDEVGRHHLSRVIDKVIDKAATEKIERAKRKGRTLRSYELDAYGYGYDYEYGYCYGLGHGAGETFVRASRFFFRQAMRQRLIRCNPAAGVEVPKRQRVRERPLVAGELEELNWIWCAGNDPELDSLLFEFHRKTAAPRQGGLTLHLGALDRRQGAVNLTAKFGQTCELPLDVDFIHRLETFARSRGATGPADHVFRSARHTPITRRRYETINERIYSQTTQPEVLDIGANLIRHKTLDDIRTVAGTRVAASYAGLRYGDGATINRFDMVTFDERAAAYEAIFGPLLVEHHRHPPVPGPGQAPTFDRGAGEAPEVSPR